MAAVALELAFCAEQIVASPVKAKNAKVFLILNSPTYSSETTAVAERRSSWKADRQCFRVSAVSYAFNTICRKSDRDV